MTSARWRLAMSAAWVWTASTISRSRTSHDCRLTTHDCRRLPMTRRTQQMSEFLREEVVDIIRSEIDDPRLGFWTITRVEVLPDLRSARIYVSVLGSDGERKETITALRGAAGFIRGHLKPRMHTRIIPDLDFRADRSMEP